MKFNSYRLSVVLSLFILLPLFSGCKKEEQPDYSFELSSSSLPSDGSSSVTIEPKGEVIPISFITSNTSHSWDYRIASGSSWIDSEKSGNRVTLTFAANESDASRSGSVIFTLGDNSRTISFSQEAIDFSFTFTTLSPYFDDDVLSFPTTGESVTFEFSGGTAGYDWDFELESSSDWITATRDGNNLTLTTEGNETDRTRNTTLTLTFGTKRETINISQEAIDFDFSITSSSPYYGDGSLFLPSEGGELTLLFTPVTAGLPWSITKPSGNDWLTIEKLGDNIEVTVGANTSTYFSRNLTITITHGNIRKYIAVTQQLFESLDVQNYQEYVNGVTFQMLGIFGGSFMMGDDGPDSFPKEQPVHEVALSSYYIGKYEVTQKLWVAVMGSNPSYFKGDNLPVENVSWNDVQDFLTELNRLTGKNYALPTEAQWEFAARDGANGRGYIYSGSDNANEVMWHYSNSGQKTRPVGSKASNDLRIHDMSGNVWEWCSDWYDPDYYSSSPTVNPQGPASGSFRVLRGGSWSTGVMSGRVASRNYTAPDNHSETTGFRLVRIRD